MKKRRGFDADLPAIHNALAPFYPEYAANRGLRRSRLWHRWLLGEIGSVVKDHLMSDPPCIVDLGAGGCVVPLCLARAGAEVTCVDTWREYDPNDPYGEGRAFGNSQVLLAALREHGLSLLEHDLASRPWPLPDAQYDIVTWFDVIEHIWFGKDVLRSVHEIRRVCKPGGLVFVTTPNAAMLRNRLKLLCGMSIYHDLDRWLRSWPYTGHVREFDFREIRHIFESAGFRLVRQSATDSMLWNHRRRDGTWASGIPVSAYGLALAAYNAITWCYPRWRHTFLSVFTKP